MQPCKDKSWHDEKGFMGGLRLMTLQFADFEVCTQRRGRCQSKVRRSVGVLRVIAGTNAIVSPLSSAHTYLILAQMTLKRP